MTNPIKRAPSQRGRIKTTPGQSNHDGCMLPPELSAWKDDPLYLLVARWCQMQKAWVGRKQIAQAFLITERRASFQVSYLTRKSDCIRCDIRRVKNDGAPNSSYEIWVHDVHRSPSKKRETTTSQPGRRRRQRVGNVDSSVRAMLNQLWPGPRREEDK